MNISKTIKIVMLILVVGLIFSLAYNDANHIKWSEPIYNIPSVFVALLVIIALGYGIALLCRKFTKVVYKSDFKLRREVLEEIDDEDHEIKDLDDKTGKMISTTDNDPLFELYNEYQNF